MPPSHSIAGGKPDQLLGRFGFMKRSSLPDNLIELLEHFGLIFDQYLGVTDRVHEKDMSDLKSDVRWHVTGVVGC